MGFNLVKQYSTKKQNSAQKAKTPGLNLVEEYSKTPLEVNGINFGGVTRFGREAIEKDRLDSYRPKDKTEADALDRYKKYLEEQEKLAASIQRRDNALKIRHNENKIAELEKKKKAIENDNSSLSKALELQKENAALKRSNGLVNRKSGESATAQNSEKIKELKRDKDNKLNAINAKISGLKTDVLSKQKENDYIKVITKYGIDPETFTTLDLAKWQEENNYAPPVTVFNKPFVINKGKYSEEKKKEYEILSAIADSNDIEHFAKSHPAIASTSTVVAAPVRGISGTMATVKSVTDVRGGKPVDTDGNLFQLAKQTNLIRGTVDKEYASKWFKGKEGKLGNYGSLFYNGLMSIGDNVANTLFVGALTGSLGLPGGGTMSAKEVASLSAKFTAGLMSGDAAANAIIQNKEKGMSDSDAVTLGIASGLIEYVTENIGLERVFGEGGTSVLKRAWASFASEGAEEIASNHFNRIADVLVRQSDSDLAESVRKYMSEGMSRQEAMKKTLEDCVWEDISAGLVGGLSGLAMAGAYDASNAPKIIRAGKYFKGFENDVVKTGLESDKNTEAYKNAERLKNKLDKKGKLSNYEIGMQYYLNGKQVEDSSDIVKNMSSSIKPSQDIGKYSKSEIDRIAEYANNIDTGLYKFADYVLNSKGQEDFKRYNISPVNERLQKDIKQSLNTDVNDYMLSINSNAIKHINNRHGEKGKADNSMALTDDIARLPYITATYDFVTGLKDSKGEPVYSKEFKNADGTNAKMLMLSKKIDGTYYTALAVPESKYKKIWIVSAYISKSDVTQVPNGEISPLGFTSKNALASPSDNSISQNEDAVKLLNEHMKEKDVSETVKSDVIKSLEGAVNKKGVIAAAEKISKAAGERFKSKFDGEAYGKMLNTTIKAISGEIDMLTAAGEYADTYIGTIAKDSFAYRLFGENGAKDLVNYVLTYNVPEGKNAQDYRGAAANFANIYSSLQKNINDARQSLYGSMETDLSPEITEKVSQAVSATLKADTARQVMNIANEKLGGITGFSKRLAGEYYKNGTLERFANLFTDNGESVINILRNGVNENDENKNQTGTVRERTDDVYGNGNRRISEHTGEPGEGVSEGTGETERNTEERREAETQPEGRSAFTENLKIGGKLVNKNTKGVEYAEIPSNLLKGRNDAESIIKENKKKGIKTVFFSGYAERDGSVSRGFAVGDTVYVMYDNDTYLPEQINAHEIVHCKSGTETYNDLRINIKAGLLTGELQDIYADYFTVYEKELFAYIQDLKAANPEMTGAEEFEATLNYLLEEFIGDINGGMNGVEEYSERFKEEIEAFNKEIETEAKTAKMEKATKGEANNSPSEYAESTDAGGESRLSIITLDNGKQYVEASRQVITGNDVKTMRKDITAFFKEILKSGSVDIVATNGDILTISRDTAKKARDNYYYQNGKSIKLSDDEFMVKISAEAHIDEIAEISNQKGRRTTDKKNHDFAKDGFTYREAYFKDFDGKYYMITLSVGNNNGVATIYNVTPKENNLPSGNIVSRRGSKAVGKLSSNDNIPQKSGEFNSNSTQKSEAKAGQNPEKNSDVKLSKSDGYEKALSIQNEINELTQEIRGMEGSEEFKSIMDLISKCSASGEVDRAIEEYVKWKNKSGYEEAIKKRDALQNELGNLRKKLQAEYEKKEADSEKEAIRKSGLNEAEYFREKAVKEFGYTPYFYDAGYIVPNGKMLNFSGEKGKHFGTRGEDHRSIGIIYANSDGSEAMIKFMNDGNIRIMAESPGIDISSSVKPSAEQYSTIRKFAREYSKEGYFNIDFTDKDGRTVGSYEYSGNISAERIVNDIKYFFDNGEIREQSSVSQFYEPRFSKVTDSSTLDFLDKQDKIKVYRAMQIIDGKLYPPMATKTKDDSGKKKLVDSSSLGVWEQADERPELIKDGKYELDKANGSSIKAAYNPYFYTSRTPLNDQFSSAYKRNNLVVVEGEVPSSELTSSYKAKYAKDAVGEVKWHSGVVSSKLPKGKERRVILSRWFKPTRIVPDSEVASIIADVLDGENISIPYNVVTPQLAEELKKANVQIDENYNGKKKDLSESVKFSKNSITADEIKKVQSIGRKSVNDFTSDDIKKTEAFAKRYYDEMGVKSPFFRAWFGDWRANDKKTKVKIAIIPPYVNSNEARKINRGNIKNDDTGWDINVSRQGETNTISHSGSEKLSERGLAGIKDIIAKAVLFDTEVHTHHKNNAANDLIAFDHKLYALGKDVRGSTALYKVTVEEYFQDSKHENVKRFHNLKYITKIADIPADALAAKNRSGGSTMDLSAKYSIADLFTLVKTYDKNFNPKPVSKVVNKDGTPEVMHHGTNGKFTVFEEGKNNGWLGKGIYFAENKNYAKENGKRVIEAYLDVKNPFIVERNSPGDVFSEIKDRFPQADEFNLAEVLKQNNYDGIMFKHWDSDIGAMISVFNRNQIKSVAENIGTFDSENPDIRFSKDVDKSGKKEYNNKQSGVMWTAENDALSKKEIAQFYEKISETKSQGYSNYNRSADGELIYEIGDNKLVYTDGDYDYPRISKVVKISADNTDDFELIKGVILNGERKGYPFENSIKAVDDVYGEGYVAVTNHRDNKAYNKIGEPRTEGSESSGAFADSRKDVRFSIDSFETQDLIISLAEETGYTGGLIEASKKNRDEFRELIKENKELTKRLENAKRQLKLTKEPTVSSGKVIAKTKEILKSLNSKADVKQTSKKIYDVYTKYIKEFKEAAHVEGAEQQALDNMIMAFQDIAAEMISASEVMAEGEDYKNLVAYLRSQPISLASEYRNDINYNDFRKANMGTLRLENDGLPVDVVYAELTEMFPHLFDENIAHPAEQLERIAEVKDSIKPKTYNPYDGYAEEAIDFTVSQLITEASDVLNGYTRADKLVETALYEQRQEFEKKYEDLLKRSQEYYEKAVDKAEEQKYIRYWEKRLLEEKSQSEKNEIRERLKKLRSEKNEKIDRTKEEMRERIDKLRENQKIKALKASIRATANDFKQRLFNTYDKNGAPIELVKEIAEVCSMLDFSTNRPGKDGGENKTTLKLADMRDKYDQLAKDPDYDISSAYDPEMSEKILNLNRVLEGRKIAELGINELSDLDGILKEIRHVILTANKQIGIENALTNKEIGTKIIHQFNEQKNYDRSFVSKALAAMARETLNPMRVARMVSGYDESSEFYKLFEQINDGVHKMQDFKMVASKPFDELVHGGANSKLFNTYASKLIDTGIKDFGGKNVFITKDMICELLLAWERKQGRNHLEGGGFKIPKYDLFFKGDIVGAFKEGDGTARVTEADIARLYGMLDEYDLMWLERAKYLYRTVSTNATNKTSMVLKGRKIATVLNYIRLHVDTNFVNKEIDGIMTNISIEGSGMLKSEVKGANQPLILTGLSQNVSEHIDEVGRYYGLAIPIRNFNKVYKVNEITESAGRDSVQQALASTWGNGIKTKVIEQVIKDLQGSRPRAGSVFDSVQANFVAATLNANISVCIKQAASFPTAAYVVGDKPLAKALATHVNAEELIKEIDAHTGLHYRRRIGLSLQELGDLSNSDTIVQRVTNKLDSVLTNQDNRVHISEKYLPSRWIQSIDVWTTGKLWSAAKYYVADTLGIKETDNNYWDEVTKTYAKIIEETQPNYDVLHRPEVQKTTNALWRAAVMFQTQPLQNSGILYSSIGNYIAKAQAYKCNQTAENKQLLNEAKREIGRAVTALAQSAVIFSIMTLLARLALHKVKRYRDEKEKGEVSGKKMLLGVLGDIGTQAVTITAPVFGSPLINLANGYEFEVPVAQTINKLVKSLGSLKNAASDIAGTEAYLPLSRKVGKVLSASAGMLSTSAEFLGVPAGNYQNIVNGAVKYIQDIINQDAFSSDMDEYKPKYVYNYNDLAKAISNGNIKNEKTVKDYFEKCDREINKAALTRIIKPAYTSPYRTESERRRIKKILIERYGYKEKTIDGWLEK